LKENIFDLPRVLFVLPICCQVLKWLFMVMSIYAMVRTDFRFSPFEQTINDTIDCDPFVGEMRIWAYTSPKNTMSMVAKYEECSIGNVENKVLFEVYN
jgi:hypothetical protein